MTDAEVKLLEKLGEKVGSAGGEAWSILVNAAFISGVADLVQYIILGVVIFFYLKQFHKWTSAHGTEAGYDIVMFVTGIILGLLTLCAFVELHETIMAFANPKYWALKKLIATCK